MWTKNDKLNMSLLKETCCTSSSTFAHQCTFLNSLFWGKSGLGYDISSVMKKERECARFLERKELPVVEGAATVTTSSSFCSFSPSVERGTNEEMSTPSREESSLDRERGWWNADLERGMEKLAVEGAVTGAASGNKNSDGKADHWQSGALSTKEEGEKVRRVAAERQEMNGVIPEIQPSSNETEGDFIMCEVEEQQAACRSRGPKKKSSDTCGIRRNARLRS